MANVKNFLESHPSATPSQWRKMAEWRIANRRWLKRSQQIALAILSNMDNMGLSQKDLAERMNVTPQYVSKLLKGKENLSLETISRVEEALDINILVIQNFYNVASVEPASHWDWPEFEEVATYDLPINKGDSQYGSYCA